MFPGYLFARFDYAAFHRLVRQRPAVSGFVQFGDRLALLPDALVNEMKMRIGTDEFLEIDQGLEPGQNVQIAQGTFQGLEALVTRLIRKFSSNVWGAVFTRKPALRMYCQSPI
jgi:transcriptional antiterminator RfaH